jgi:hypothetical protein
MLARCYSLAASEYAELERLIRAPRCCVRMPPSISKLEHVTEGLTEACRIVAHYWKAAASFWPVKCEGRNDRVPSYFQGSL